MPSDRRRGFRGALVVALILGSTTVIPAARAGISAGTAGSARAAGSTGSNGSNGSEHRAPSAHAASSPARGPAGQPARAGGSVLLWLHDLLMQALGVAPSANGGALPNPGAGACGDPNGGVCTCNPQNPGGCT